MGPEANPPGYEDAPSAQRPRWRGWLWLLVLLAVGLTVGVVALVMLARGRVPGDGEALGPAPDAPFGVWEAVRRALRTSPDHLAAVADDLVAAKDPERIYQFVRDQIVTFPPYANQWRDAEFLVRGGVRGTLRGGAAGCSRLKPPATSNMSRRGQVLSPSPRGEGRGEGEQRTRLHRYGFSL
jgi:hypothetical protein